MWIADMDFVSPEPVVRALKARVEHGVFGYPQEMPQLRQAIVERMEKVYGWQILPEEVIFIQGVIPGFNQACHICAEPGEGILVGTPIYTPILRAAVNTGRSSHQVPLIHQADGSYDIDWEAFETAILPDTRLFILCNPHNPMGRVFRKEELERLAQICLQQGLMICADEIHSDLIYPGNNHVPIASLDREIARRTITLMSPSKTYNLAGLKFAFAIIQDEELRQRYQKSGFGVTTWVNLMAQVAALAAYQEGQEWLEQLLDYLKSNRDYLYEYTCSELPGVKMAKPEGTYLAWLDCREAPLEKDPAKFFLDQARVALSDGASFGPGGEGFVRMNFGCPRPWLEQALLRMKIALEKEHVSSSALDKSVLY